MAASATTYRVLAVLLAIAIAIALVIGYMGAKGPGVMDHEPAVVALYYAMFAVAIVLFTFLLRIGEIFDVEKRLNATIEREASRLAKLQARPVPTPTPPPMAAAPVTNIPLTAVDERQHVITIEGIGTKYAARLNAMGIISIPQLMRADANRVATNIQVEPDMVREWQDMGQLMRLKGVGPQSAEVLVRSGIRSVDQLAATSPETVSAKVKEAESGRKVRIQGQDVTPGVAKRWVEAAKNGEFDAE